MTLQDLTPFFRMRLSFLRNILRFRNRGDVFKFCVISAFIAGFWISSLMLFLRGFDFLESFPGIGEIVADRMVYLVFGVIFFMLIASTAIIAYSTHYRSEELPFLFAMPVQDNTIFLYKSFHAVFLSSWASVFLTSPMLLAYGLTRNLGACFYVISAILFLVQVTISGMIGIMLAMLIIGRIKGRLLRILGLGSVTILFLVTFLALRYQKDYGQDADAVLAMLNTLLHHTRIFLFPLLPSYWMSEALLSLSKDMTAGLTFYSLLLVSTGLVSLVAVESLARRMYFGSWLRAQGVCTGERSLISRKLDLVSRALGFIPRDTASLVIKDIKTFLRDPQQWSQALIFFGLLFVYLINLRKMPYDIEAVFWKKLILFLNVTSIITILAMLGARFAFPLVSLEGKRFWITLLSPMELRQLILEKFWITGAGLFVMGGVLVVTLNIMLKTPSSIFAISSVAVASASFALSGLSIGIGTLFPNFREDNLARISSGFGGTLLLVLTLIYIFIIVVLGAIPVFAVRESSRFFHLSTAAVGAGFILVSLFCAVFPVSAGIKSLSRSDF